MITTILLMVYTLASWLILLYTMNLVYLFVVRNRRKEKFVIKELKEPPPVTVQLPIYNELYVADRIIDAAASLDYPRDRLQILVLDDSTDETMEICRRKVAQYRRLGLNIQLINRMSRTDYKAGALSNALKHSSGEFIAVFDSDFVPPREFLLRLLPYFTSEDIGMVQSRWGYLNMDYSFLTISQSVMLDVHFLVEQYSRNQNGYFINFNGSAGVWRKHCIESSGGWQPCLAEDLDLSYRAQLRGWKLVYTNDVVSPCELPVQVNSVMRQQFRWAKGSIECFLKLYREILGSNIGLVVKLQAILRLTGHIVFPLTILQFTLLPILLLLGASLNPLMSMASLLAIVCIQSFAIRILTKDKLPELLLKPILLLLLGIGMSVNNTKAVLEALIGKRSDFLRTPKFRIRSISDTWREKKYALKASPLVLAHVALSIYGCFGLLIAIISRQFALVPYLAFCTAAFAYIGILAITHSAKDGKSSARSPKKSPQAAIILSQTVCG